MIINIINSVTCVPCAFYRSVCGLFAQLRFVNKRNKTRVFADDRSLVIGWVTLVVAAARDLQEDAIPAEHNTEEQQEPREACHVAKGGVT